MVNKGLIANPNRGYYQHPKGLIKPVIYPFFELHGLKFESRCYKVMGWPYPDLLQFVTTRLRQPWLHKHPKNKAVTTTAEWSARTVSITIHTEKTQLIEIFLKAGNDALSPIEFVEYCGWIVGLFGIPPEFWELKQKGINIDIQDAKFTGPSSVSMKVAQDIVMKIYQKGKDIRFETHDTKVMNGKQALNFMAEVLRIEEAFNGKMRK